jgi:glycyl-tRNA synthetase alpha chain
VPATISSATVPTRTEPLTFQQLLFRLQTFWAERGCILQQPYDVEVGAGTMSPDTFLRVLGPKPINIAYAQPSRRPADGRYGENPNRLYKHTQFQVILKPPPADIQEVYLESLAAIGIDLAEHDIKFEEDNWESPTLGAWGIGWQVMLDGLEVTQFTYFQQCGGIDLDPISGEITYGLERLTAFLQNVDSLYDIVWARDPRTGKAITYGDIRLDEEIQFSVYNFEAAEVEKLWEHLRLYEAECQALLASYNDSFSPVAEKQGERRKKIHGRVVHDDAGNGSQSAAIPAVEDATTEDPRAQQRRFPVLGAYDLCLRCSHLFNLLDARGAISVTERVGVIARIRALAVGVAKAYVAQQGA